LSEVLTTSHHNNVSCYETIRLLTTC